MSNFKEPGYFLDSTDKITLNTSRNKLRLGLDDDALLRLVSLGYSGQPWLGESSTYYSMYPYFGEEVPKNISMQSPDAKIIYIVRHPLERIISQFLWGERNKFAEGNFNEVLEKRFDVMASISSYATQIKRYTNSISAESFFFIKFDELASNPKNLVSRIFKFLDLDMVPMRSMNLKPHYVSRNRREHSPSSLLFSKDQLSRLNKILLPEMEEFSKISGLDLLGWDFSSERWAI